MPAGFEDIQHAADLLRRGEVVAFPTETVYGLGADAFNAGAIDRVYELKGRPRHNPLIVHVSGPEMAQRVARSWPERAATLARRFWPGPLSILVPRRSELPAVVTAGGDLVAVRCPNHPIALALLFELNAPLVGPSANISGHVSPTTAEHVREAFDARGVFVLDGGACEAGIESTVVDVTSDPPRVLRPGVIGVDALSAALGYEVIDASRTARGEALTPLPSPGLLDRHYSPRATAYLFEEQDWPLVKQHAATQPGVVVLSHRLMRSGPGLSVIEMPPDAAGYAAAMYASLRQADHEGANLILVERPPTGVSEGDDPLWIAIADRLSRATLRLPADWTDAADDDASVT